jgi:hypothetical protein
MKASMSKRKKFAARIERLQGVKSAASRTY